MDRTLSVERYAAFATHSPESCTLNNKTNKEIFMQFEDKLNTNMEKYGIKKIVNLFVSVPEHHYIIVVEAESALGVENMCIDLGMTAYNTVKIVPLKTFEELRNRLKESG